MVARLARLFGDFYIADVGEWLREEVNYLPADQAGGQNFGWHCWEGTVDYTLIQPKVAPTCQQEVQYTFPVFEYDHSHGECSVIGGKIYRGTQYPALYGRYFFGDWCTGQLWTMYQHQGQWQVEAIAGAIAVHAGKQNLAGAAVDVGVQRARIGEREPADDGASFTA